jgi:protein involved in polysaccharide export with SLBB domain
MMPRLFTTLLILLGLLGTVLLPGFVPSGLAATGTAGYSQAAPYQARLEVNKNAYRLGPGDVLSVHVLNQLEFTQPDLLVMPDGAVSFNGIGEITVSGKTLEEVTRLLEYEYGEWLKHPRVTVRVTRSRPATIYLSGAVAHPGSVQLQTDSSKSSGGGSTAVGSPNNSARYDLTLGNVLANAGGVLPNADLSKVEITRAYTKTTQTIDLWQYLQGGHSANDVALQPGDSIHVPMGPQTALSALSDTDFSTLIRSSIGPGTFPVRILGQVTKPGLVPLDGLSPYLNTAITQTGGYLPGANQKVVAIRRFTSDKDFTTLFVEPNKTDITLRPNDIVYVSETGVYKTGRFAEVVGRVLAPFTNIGTTAFLFRR